MADTCEERWQTRKSTVLERNMHMFNNPVMSDINFAFPDHDKRIISAHKYVLATSSPVFFVMFYGELRETNETIEIGESDPDIFLQFLRFLYCDDASFQNENNAIQLLYLADKYDVPSLAAKCNEFQDRAMEPLNAFGIVPHARKLNHEKLERSCWEVIDYNAKEIMDDNSFSELSHELLLDVVKRSSLRIDEVSLFKAVDRWATKRCADETMAVDGASKRSLLGEELLRKIRFPVMSPQEFSDAVIPSDILSKDEIIDVLKQFSSVSISGAYKFLSDPRTKGDVSADSCALGTEWSQTSGSRSFLDKMHRWKRGVLTFTLRRPIRLCGVTIITKVSHPESVSVSRGGKILRMIKNHKSLLERERPGIKRINVIFDRPVLLYENFCYTIETSTGSTHDSSFAVLSSSLMPFYSEKPDSEHNRNRVNSNTLVSGVCSGKFTPIPADNHYIGEVLALLFQPAVMKKK